MQGTKQQAHQAQGDNMMSCHITILSNYNTNITYKFQTNG
jgi:hypothetical protein